MKTVEFLVGSAIGDAGGAGLEMQDKTVMQDLTFDRWYNLRTGQYAVDFHPSDYTDDMEHVIGVVELLTSENPFTKEGLLRYWKQEYDQDKARKGHPRQGHGSIEDFYKGKKTIEEIRHLQAEKEHPGNGPVMRAAPLGYLPEQVMFRYAEINADVTHPHPEARIGSAMVASTAHYLLNNGRHDGLLAYLGGKQEFTSVQRQLEQVDTFGPPETLTDEQHIHLCGPQPIRGATGMIYGLPTSAIHTAITAGYILKHTEDPFLGLKRSIQIGGDVDSLATVCVGILAGRYGLSTVPAFMQDEVEGRDRLESLGRKFENFLSQMRYEH